MRRPSFVRGPSYVVAVIIWIIALPGCSPVDDVSRTSTPVSSLTLPPTIAAHALVFQRQHGELTQLALPPLSSGGRDGLVLISIGRGIASATQAPLDSSSGLLATQIGEPHRYTKYAESGTALYSIAMPSGAPARKMITHLPAGDELTMAAVQVGRTHVQDVAWKEAYPGKIFGRNTVRSARVRTSGPATLVAFWWGDAGVRGEKTAVPGQGFRVLDTVLFEGALVQCAVAVKEVDAAGDYDVTWTATPRQAAQLWLIALQ